MGLQDVVSQYTGTVNLDALKEYYSNGFDWDNLKDRKVLAGIFAGVGATYLLYKQITKKRYKLPPGPMPLPLIGNFHNLGFEDLHIRFQELSKVYGSVFTVYFGPVRFVVVNDYESMKEAFLVKGADYGNRPKVFSSDIFTDDGKDIAMGQYGPVWKLQRKIAHSALRKYAGGDRIEKLVKDSCERVFADLDKFDGPVDIRSHLMVFIYNVFATMCFGKTYTLEDPFIQFVKRSFELFNEPSAMAQMVDFIPILQKDFMGLEVVKQLKDMAKEWNAYIGTEYDEHIDTYDPDNLSDFFYDLIHLAKEAENDPNQRSEYLQLTKSHFIMVAMDIFSAGTDTTRYTLEFIFSFLIKHPEVQEKIHEEMQEVLGSDPNVPLTIKSREKLHYLEAVIHEVMRIRPVAPQAVPHVTACDTTLGEYEIPKDTFVVANIWSIHLDPKNFPEPDVFKPERWLDNDGKFTPRIGPYVPFSMGKRVCVGESLAKVEISLTTALFLRKYKFEAVPGEEVNTDGVFALGGLFPSPYNYLISKRY